MSPQKERVITAEHEAVARAKRAVEDAREVAARELAKWNASEANDRAGADEALDRARRGLTIAVAERDRVIAMWADVE